MTDQNNGVPFPPSDSDDPGKTEKMSAEQKKEERKRKREERKRNKKPAKPVTFGKAIGAGAISAVVVVALVMCLWAWTPLFDGIKSSGSSSSGSITINGDSTDTTTAEAVASKCLDSVVTIYVTSDNSDWTQYFNNSGSSSDSSSALGSGVIISDEGDDCYILTNYHVVEDISKATVKVGDKSYNATAVGYDEKSDLAVIKIKASGLTAVEWGDSSEMSVGDWVMAIGSPYGYSQTATTGIVSALYRSDVVSSSDGLGGTTVYTDMIQTDAAINPGNSGGGLFNSKGQLIGINTYIASTSESSAGLGFAIPSSTAQSIAEELMQGKEITHAFLGITMQDSTDSSGGVTVTSVYKDTAAAKAGLQTGDVITKVDGKDITSASDVSVAVSSKNVGDTISITYERNGKENTVEATLGDESDASSEYAENGSPESSSNGSDSSGSNGYGYDYGDLNDLFGQLFGNGSGSSSGSGSNSGQNGSSGSSDAGSFWE
ncbi:MAG: S1C family serine protease [Coriobacteriales bacterium]|jgi:putative serine protease PepD